MMVAKRVFLSVSVLICLGLRGLHTPGEAKVLEARGTTFDIREQSLLEVIQKKLQGLCSPHMAGSTEGTQKLEALQKGLQDRVRRFVERPRPVAGIGMATAYRVREYDPSFLVGEDIKDHEGKMIARKGTSINPLQYHNFGKPLLLINGDDADQVAWALGQEGKVVLLQGAPLRLMETHRRAFYFDQGGILAKKFGIQNVPARISQRVRDPRVKDPRVKDPRVIDPRISDSRVRNPTVQVPRIRDTQSLSLLVEEIPPRIKGMTR